MANNLCDQLIDYINEDLDERSREEFEKHLKECSDCREELKEFEALTEDLPYASEPVNPPDGMKERILANVLAEEQNDAGMKEENFTTAAQETADPIPFPKREARKPKGKLRWWTPVLAAALLLSLAGNAYSLFKENHNKDQNNSESADVAAAMKSVQLQSTEAMKQSQGSATLLKTDDGRVRVIVQAKGLKQLKGSKVYQVWLIDGKKPYRAGTFVPDRNGGGAVSYKMDLPKSHSWDQVAISQEPTPNSQTPKGQIILVSKL